jgi:putative membrane protein
MVSLAPPSRGFWTSALAATLTIVTYVGCGSDSNRRAIDASVVLVDAPTCSVPPGMDTGMEAAPPDTAVGTSSLEDASVAVSDATVVLSDSAIAGAMMEANTGEVVVGDVAQLRAHDPAVIAFAKRMMREHSVANAHLTVVLEQNGIVTEDSEVSRTLTAATVATVQKLSALKGAGLDAAYLASQIDMHQQVLQLLDAVLIPEARLATLRAELMANRTAVVSHLAAARALAARDGGVPDAAAEDTATEPGAAQLDAGADAGMTADGP